MGLVTLLLLLAAPMMLPKCAPAGLAMTGLVTLLPIGGARMFSKCAIRFDTPAPAGLKLSNSTSSVGSLDTFALRLPNDDVWIVAGGDGAQSMDELKVRLAGSPPLKL
jgi:hypothetical protein